MKPRARRQCAKCPWRVGVDPFDIPNGYDVDKHRALARTIAKPGALWNPDDELRLMACHGSPVRSAFVCVGWLHNQLGDGNNLRLRLTVRSGALSGHYILRGRQHACFEDTLPKHNMVDARPPEPEIEP